MFRTAFTAVCRTGVVCHRLAPIPIAKPFLLPQLSKELAHRTFISLTASPSSTTNTAVNALANSLNSLQFGKSKSIQLLPPIRTVTKFSWKKGKRKTVKAVIRRFFRLRWGGWIRTRCGRHKKMHKKSGNRKRRLRQHVLVNGQQATLLDKMVTKYWKRPRYYMDDIYEPYHTRTYFGARRDPAPYPPQPLTKRKPAYELAKLV